MPATSCEAYVMGEDPHTLEEGWVVVFRNGLRLKVHTEVAWSQLMRNIMAGPPSQGPAMVHLSSRTLQPEGSWISESLKVDNGWSSDIRWKSAMIQKAVQHLDFFHLGHDGDRTWMRTA